MNGEYYASAKIEEQPRVIQNVTDANLNELLASLAQRGAWVLSMERKGAVYSLQVSWRDANEADQI